MAGPLAALQPAVAFPDVAPVRSQWYSVDAAAARDETEPFAAEERVATIRW